MLYEFSLVPCKRLVGHVAYYKMFQLHTRNKRTSAPYEDPLWTLYVPATNQPTDRKLQATIQTCICPHPSSRKKHQALSVKTNCCTTLHREKRRPENPYMAQRAVLKCSLLLPCRSKAASPVQCPTPPLPFSTLACICFNKTSYP